MDKLVNKIENIVKVCGNKIINVSNNEIKVEDKEGRGNIVTNYDKEIQNILVEELGKLIDSVNFICEEEDMDDGISENGYTFIIDPIDGTVNFSRKLSLSAISVALFKDGQPYISVCYNPYTDELFKAEIGKGAYLNDERIYVSNKRLNEGIIMAGNAPYNVNYQNDSISILSKFMNVANDYRRIGSAVIELCSIACGRAELYFELEISVWDYAAAYLIVREAGGIITDINGNDIKFDRVSSILASNGREDYLKYINEGEKLDERL